MAEVNVSAANDVITLVDRVRRRSSGGLIVALLGGLSVAEAETLSALRASGTTCIGLYIDPSTWLNLPEEARRQADADQELAATALLRSGWRIVPIRHGDSLTAL